MGTSGAGFQQRFNCYLSLSVSIPKDPSLANVENVRERFNHHRCEWPTGTTMLSVACGRPWSDSRYVGRRRLRAARDTREVACPLGKRGVVGDEWVVLVEESNVVISSPKFLTRGCSPWLVDLPDQSGRA